MNEQKIELCSEEKEVVSKLLKRMKNNPPELEDIWQLMDCIWDELNCDNCRLHSERMAEFYKHPVWLLNGLFVESHDLSIQHRSAIADWIAQNPKIDTVLDYGGGFGTLARFIAQRREDIKIDIYEPYPSQSALVRISNYPQISFIKALEKKYDCLVSTDVLEHVPDPLGLLADIVNSVSLNGFLIIANCFYPVIKCHLPCTFHLRYSFNSLARMMGMQFISVCQGSHASIYQKVDETTLNWPVIRTMELVSKISFPILETAWGYHLIKSLKLFGHRLKM